MCGHSIHGTTCRTQLDRAPAPFQLLSCGANPAAASGDGDTPAALARKHRKVYKVLEQAMSAMSNQRGTRFPSSELVAAASRGSISRVATLLGQSADPDSTDGSLTALHRACVERQPSVAQLLLDARASHSLTASSKGIEGMAALHLAAK